MGVRHPRASRIVRNLIRGWVDIMAWKSWNSCCKQTWWTCPLTPPLAKCFTCTYIYKSPTTTSRESLPLADTQILPEHCLSSGNIPTTLIV
ncbi:hypothetical protein AG1IA_01985 [Rhizoctonia solani AG-1 IA]|uniref:Uncharacterized protein n=1 Tax=Thanatephorus cucumeris (strain AG1-IA) TaxID=983506 RepID=L8X5U2_THACA|nr:hypothetical protein AG1IA_01985 [Rhizoctonia solani AG-1 IA]